jgi:3D (Asp-Asp-Asp) domain-containing protein
MRMKNLFIAVVAILGVAAYAADNVIQKVESKPIPHKTIYQVSREVAGGRMVTRVKGVDGEVRTTYQVTTKDGQVVSKKALFSTRTEPVDKLVLIGRQGVQTSRGSYTRGKVKVLTMTATAYDTSPQTLPGSSGLTATGIPAEFGIVAVDPRVIPLGTMVFVEGYGIALAADTGGAIKGNRIDLCYDSRSEALAFGRRKVRVHILGK